MAVTDKPNKPIDILLDGKLVTGADPTLIGKNFSVLKNMRYTDSTIKSIGGQSKINTTIPTTYIKFKSGYHFRKTTPAESHVIVQAKNSAETAGVLWDNTTAIPNAGDFSATALYTESASAGLGRFSSSPDGCVAYCNGAESLIWGGNEYRAGGVINFDGVNPDTNTAYFSNDITELVNTPINDANHRSTVKSVTETVDANTMLLLHLDNNVTDSSPTTIHTVTPTDITYDATNKHSGTHAAVFNGTTSVLTIPTNADFDFSGGNFTIEMVTVNSGSPSAATPLGTLYEQITDANNRITWYVDGGGAADLVMRFEIWAASSKVVEMTKVIRAAGTVESQGVSIRKEHWAIVESGDSWYMFRSGSIVAQATDTSRAANYTGSVTIGNGTGGYLRTYAGNSINVDEIRVSNTARWTSTFTPRTQAYGAAVTTSLYLGSTRPIKGAKFYVSTENATTTSSTTEAYYWDGANYAPITITADGTKTGSKALAQTGSVTFASTVSTAKLSVINKSILYWYKFVFYNVDDTTSLYYISVDAPVQPIVDIWDGVYRKCSSAEQYIDSSVTLKDWTINLADVDYDSNNTGTYASLNSMPAGDYLLIGFPERQTALNVTLVGGASNTNSSLMSVYYWNGSQSWASVGTVVDGTSVSGKSFAKSGVVSWNAPSETVELKRDAISQDGVVFDKMRFFQDMGGRVNKPGTPFKIFTPATATGRTSITALYYYKVQFTAAFSGSVSVDAIEGISAQKTITGYSFPVKWQDKLGLCAETNGASNSILLGARGTVCVFNGEDSTSIDFGGEDKLISAMPLYSRYSGYVAESLVICKANETWLLDFNGTDYIKYLISANYGCIAPETMRKCDLGYEISPGINRHVLIWESANGVVLFDGYTVAPIHDDIKDLFDPTSSTYKNTTYSDDSTSFFDERNREYHWLFAGNGSTTLNKEMAYDVLRKKWYETDRTSGKRLNFGFTATDTTGNAYNYGGVEAGYLYRLENGNTFDSVDITSTFRNGDVALSGVMNESTVRKLKVIAKAKTTTDTVSITHYADTKTSGTALDSMSLVNANRRVVDVQNSTNLGPAIFHSFEFSLTTGDEDCGFEPLGVALKIQTVRTDEN